MCNVCTRYVYPCCFAVQSFQVCLRSWPLLSVINSACGPPPRETLGRKTNGYLCAILGVSMVGSQSWGSEEGRSFCSFLALRGKTPHRQPFMPPWRPSRVSPAHLRAIQCHAFAPGKPSMIITKVGIRLQQLLEMRWVLPLLSVDLPSCLPACLSVRSGEDFSEGVLLLTDGSASRRPRCYKDGFGERR